MALVSLESKLPKEIVNIIKKFCSKTHPLAEMVERLVFVRDETGILYDVIWPEKYICIPVWA